MNFIQIVKKRFSKMPSLLRVISILIVVGIAWLGFIIYRNTRRQLPQYQTVKVERGTIVSSISASGNVLTANILNVTTSANGIVKKVYVKDEDKITMNQKIAEISLDSEGQQKTQAAWANYLAAKNNLDSANATLYTLQSQMFATNQKFINDAVHRGLSVDDPTYIQENADWLASEAKYKNQVNVIAQSKASLMSAWTSYKQSSNVITAPIPGKVTNITIAEGMILAPGGTSNSQASSQRVAVIQNESNPLLTFNLTEIDVPEVKTGLKATITLDSLTDKTFTGHIITVDKIGVTTSNVTNYPIIIKLDTASGDIIPNMSASANILIESKSNVLLVPSAAIQTEGDQSIVKVLKDGQEITVGVQTGIAGDAQTEIISGVNEGDTVITGTVNKTGSQQGDSSSIFGGGGFGGGAFRPGGFGGSQRR